MQKKYKLIRQYPGSPELGTIIEKITHNGHLICPEGNYYTFGYILNSNSVENYPEFWQEIVNKDYEILEYYQESLGKLFRYNKSHVNYEYIKTCNYPIYSIKRLSDNSVFTIGDKIDLDFLNGECPYSIKNISINNKNEIIFNLEKAGKIPLFKAKHAKQVLFTTEDGVDIYEDCLIYGITSDTWDIFSQYASHGMNEKWIHGKFSTKEAAEEYILMNKPCLSINDVAKVYKTANSKGNAGYSDKDYPQFSKLKELVKSKLNE